MRMIVSHFTLNGQPYLFEYTEEIKQNKEEKLRMDAEQFINIAILDIVSPPQNQLEEKSEAGWIKHSAPHGKKNAITTHNCVKNYSMQVSSSFNRSP